MSRKYSPYFYELEEAEKLGYTQKLNKLGGIDNPFIQEPNVVGEDWECWPSVEYPDIYNYLIQTPSLYTGESLKTYKSLDTYNLEEPHYLIVSNHPSADREENAETNEGTLLCYCQQQARGTRPSNDYQ